MQIFVANLDKNTAAILKKLPCHCQPVAEIGEIGMDAKGPGIAIGSDHLRLAGEVLLAVFHFALSKLRLEVGTEFDAVRWVEINHLHFAREVFAAGEARHDLQGVAQNKAVGPIHVEFVKLNGLGIGLLWVGKKIALHILSREHAQDGLGGNAFVNVQGNRLDFKPRLFTFAGPFKPRLVFAERGGKHSGFVVVQSAFARGLEKFGKAVGFGGVGSGTERGGRCGLYAYRSLGASGSVPWAASPAGGIFFRLVGNLYDATGSPGGDCAVLLRAI